MNNEQTTKTELRRKRREIAVKLFKINFNELTAEEKKDYFLVSSLIDLETESFNKEKKNG